jgi:hypothetical protein
MEEGTLIVHCFSSFAYVWVPGAKTTGPITKVWFFLNLIFSAVRNFKFQHMFCRNKKFCTVFSGVQGATFCRRNSSVMCTACYTKVRFMYEICLAEVQKIEYNINWSRPCIPNCIAAKTAEIGLNACLHGLLCMFLPCFEFS